MINPFLEMSDNFFDKYTQLNHKLMNLLSTAHLEKLKSIGESDKEISKLFKRYEPIHDLFINNYANWVVSKYSLKFESKKINGALDELGSYLIHQWRKKIQSKFPKGTAEYSKFFPKDILPFQQGTFDERINNLHILMDLLKDHKDMLVTLKDIEDFLNRFIKLRDMIKSKETEVEKDFQQLEKSRLLLAEMLFRNYGYLLDRYGSNSDKIFTFFNFDLLINSNGNGSSLVKDGVSELKNTL